MKMTKREQESNDFFSSIFQMREMLLAWVASNLSPHMWLLLLLQATKEDIWGGHCPSEGHKISSKMSFFSWAEENLDPLYNMSIQFWYVRQSLKTI